MHIWTYKFKVSSIMVEISISKISPFGASRGMEFQNFLQPWWRRVSVKLVILGASKGHVISNFLSMSKVSHSKRIMSESDLIWLKRAYWNLENGVKFYQKTLKTSLNLQEKTLKTLKIRVNQSVYTLNQDIKNLTPAIVEGHETNVCTNF